MKAWFQSFFNSPVPTVAPPLTWQPTETQAPEQSLSALTLHHWPGARGGAFLAWMTHGELDPAADLGAPEQQVLQRLAARVSDPATHASLLPRAAGVVPALLARLRSDSSSLGELAEHVSRDPTLVAEVVAMANSAFYRRERPVMELSHSIQMLGVGGLRAAIARVVLKPMVDARSGPLIKRSAPRLWKHTEFKTQLGAEIARSQGLDPFDAYLLALLHDIAWSAVLRELDAVAHWHLSAAFVAELGGWRDRLARLIAQQWRPHGPWVRAADELAQQGLSAESSPEVLNLCAADQLAWLLCDPQRARARALADPLLSAAQPAVRACFEDLDPIASPRE
jgi:hypothetical protein